MTAPSKPALRVLAETFVATGPSGVAIRTRLKNLTPADEAVLRGVGDHLGRLAAGDLAARCAAGLAHDNHAWAARKRALTLESSARWAGTLTKATHDQWALARRGQTAHLHTLETAINTLSKRLAQPLGTPGTKKAPGGYRSAREWFGKSRRLAALTQRLDAVRTDHTAGRVHIVRGGKRLFHTRQHLGDADLAIAQWRDQWTAARAFLRADGESGKRYGNETIRITPDGEMSLKLPAPLADWANAPHGRYVLAGRARFAHRGVAWAERVTSDRAVAYRIDYDTVRGRWYVTASWQFPSVPAIALETVRAHDVIGVDTNADHFAAYRLDPHGNPVGDPHRFAFDLHGPAGYRDAQIRHAISGALRWANSARVSAVAVENLDFTAETTREKHGRRKRFRQLIAGMPTGQLRARWGSMAATAGLVIVAVDPAYTSRWGAQHWRTPLAGSKRSMTRHDAAAVAIGRRALGLGIRRRTPPPRTHRSDGYGYRSVQAGSGVLGREGTRRPVPDRALQVRRRAGEDRYAGDQCVQDRSGHAQNSGRPLVVTPEH